MTTPPEDSKLTRTKQRWAQEGRFLTGHPTHPETARLPPGQHLTRDWPVLDLGTRPNIPLDRWTLRIHGAVQDQLTLDWPAFQALPQQDITTDIHCVTTWSRYDNIWHGLPTHHLVDLVHPKPEARFVIFHSHDGYTTNLPLQDFAAENALIATHWQNTPLTAEHGGPARLIIPHLYLWKSAKWIQRIEFSTTDKPGYWELNGYHDRGDPWAEERYE